MGSCLITNSPLLSIFMIVLPRLLTARQAFMPLCLGSTLVLMFELLFLFYFIFNKKGMGLQDYLSNTKVLDLKK